MGICINGVASVTFNKKEDEDRFNELKQWFKDDDATWQMFSREKLGEVITPNSILFDRPTQLVEDTLGEFNLKDDEDIARLQKVNDNTRASFERRVKDLRLKANNLKGADKSNRDESIEKLDNLLTGIEDLDAKDQFNSIIDYSLKNLTRSLDWLKKGFDANKEVHRDSILELWKQLDTYAGLNVPEYAHKHSQLNSKINEVNSLYRSVKESIESKFKDTIVGIIEENSSKGLSKSEIEAYLRESNDIDALQKLFLDINSSTDTLLAVIAKIHADKNEQIHELNHHWSSEINKAGKKLLDAGIKNFDFMSEKDSSGNKTGNIVQKVGQAFNTKLKDLYSKLDDTITDEQGKKKRREYIKKSLEELSEEEKQHNIALSIDKKELSVFQRPEYWDKSGKGLVDGDNKKYTDDFKAARELNESYEEGGWVKSVLVSEEAYNKYLKKYYGPTQTAYRMLYDEDKKPTGEVEEYETRFVKSEHTEVTDKWDSEEYKTIQANPAMKEFYDFYKNTEKTILDLLPADVAKKMLNKVFRVKSDLYSKLLQKKTPIIKRVLKDIKGLFLPEIITSNRKLGEDNKPIDGIGIFYTTDLKDEERIAKIEEEIGSLKNSTSIEDRKKVKDLRNSLLIEKNKPTADELEYDLVDNLKTVMDMANAYDIMSSVESTFQIAQEVIRNKGFYETRNGEPILVDGKPQLKTTTSNVEERLAGWMRMVFYNNSQVNNSRIAKLGQLLKKYTSAVGVGGLAVFPAFNNIVTAEMSNIQEGFGGRFYKNKNYIRGSKLFAKTLATGKFVSHLFKQPGQYEDEKPVDLLTALVSHFNFLEENADRGAGVKQKQDLKKYITSGNVLYALTEGGEYQAQTRSALAYLDNKLVDVENDFEYTNFEGQKAKTESKKISLLDAYIFDEATKELKLRPGVLFNAKNKRDTTGEIRNMNKNIHGNHSSVDKVLIQENWWGELAFQFKRWMPNGIRNRVANRYYDESLGIEMEGRYRSVGTLLRNMEGFSLQFAKDAWGKLSDLEQANAKKAASEAAMFGIALALYIIFDAIREGTPPDDEYTRQALNFLKQQADKSQGELDFFVNPLQWYKQTKSPIAGLRTFGEVAEFISAASGVPYYGIQGRTDKLVYQKGVNKGTYKVVKEGRDLLPLFKQIGQFKQLDITGDFFIGR